MARRREPGALTQSAADYLRELRAGMHAPATSVDLSDEPETFTALLTGRRDPSRTIELHDADARARAEGRRS